MKSTGVVRRVDELGRIVLPKEIRETYNMKAQDSFDFFIDDDNIIIKKCETVCVFCDSTKDIFIFNGYSICHECMKEMASELKE